MSKWGSIIVCVVAFFALGHCADMTKYYKRTGQKYLDEVATRPGVIKLKSGMLVEIIKSNDDPDAKSPRQTDTCEVTYSGTLKDGSKFDAGTTSFAPNQVIAVC